MKLPLRPFKVVCRRSDPRFAPEPDAAPMTAPCFLPVEIIDNISISGDETPPAGDAPKAGAIQIDTAGGHISSGHYLSLAIHGSAVRPDGYLSSVLRTAVRIAGMSTHASRVIQVPAECCARWLGVECTQAKCGSPRRALNAQDARRAIQFASAVVMGWPVFSSIKSHCPAGLISRKI